jgi:hypothetical protein
MQGTDGKLRSYPRDAEQVISCVGVDGRHDLLLFEVDAGAFTLGWFHPAEGAWVPEPLVPETIPRLPEAALWDPRTGTALIVGFDEIVHTATGRRRALVQQLGRPAISLDGRLVATAGSDQPIRILNAQQLDTLDEIPIEGRFAAAPVFSPDGRSLAVTVHNRAHVYSLE